MANNRDWVDYANLASNLAQNAQLSGIQNRLSALQAVATAQASEARRAADAMERAESKGKRVAALRRVVIEGERMLGGLRHHLPAKPVAVMALAMGYRHEYQRNGLSIECFDEREDMDRVQSLYRGLDEIVEASTAKLTAEEREDAQRCFRYQSEEKELQQLIEAQQHRERHIQKIPEARRACELAERTLANLRDERREAEGAMNFGLKLAMYASPVFLIVLTAVLIPALETENFSSVKWVLAIGGGLVVLISIPFGLADEKVTRLSKEINDLDMKCASLKGDSLPLGASDYHQSLWAKFGGGIDTPSKTYETMLTLRRGFVSRVRSGESPRGDKFEKETVMATARLLQQVISQHEIESSLGDITIGKLLTRYQFHLAHSQDIPATLESALAAVLKVRDVRVSTLPGGATLVIEAVNPRRTAGMDSASEVCISERRLWRPPVGQLPAANGPAVVLEFRPCAGKWYWVLLDWPEQLGALATGTAGTELEAKRQAVLIAEEMGATVITARIRQFGELWETDHRPLPQQPGEVIPVLMVKKGTPDWENQFSRLTESELAALDDAPLAPGASEDEYGEDTDTGEVVRI